MAFESGSISFRMMWLPRALPADAVARFAQHAAPPLDRLVAGEIHGWVTGRHLLDRQIDPNTAFYGGYLRLTLMQAERKVPEALLRAECRIEELARMKELGVDALAATVRREIRESVMERLLPQMPPTLHGIHLLHRPGDRLLFTTALNDNQLEAFQLGFSQAIGFGAIPVGPETASLQRRRKSIRDWAPVSFSSEVDPEEVIHDPGLDFFMWLWFVSEERGGAIALDRLGEWSIMVEGPLTFVREGDGAHEAVVRKGEPRLSDETKAALLSGKKLRRARLVLARGEELWPCTFDAAEFTVRSLKLPKGEKLDAVSKFQERMEFLHAFCEALLALFDRFADERESKDWEKTVGEMQRWVAERKTRR